MHIRQLLLRLRNPPACVTRRARFALVGEAQKFIDLFGLLLVPRVRTVVTVQEKGRQLAGQLNILGVFCLLSDFEDLVLELLAGGSSLL